MRHASLFSGIGGFDLAAEWMGWENIFHCEWNPFGQKVLKHHFPNSISYNDIKQTNFSIHRGEIDILTGGFPCQPYSSAGNRLGKEDERHLWPEMLRTIEEVQPSWVVGENVRGLTNWGGGLVFNEVQVDLEAKGYEVLPFLLPACAVNAPHRRDRIWFIAHSISSSERANKFREIRSTNGEIKGEGTQTIYNAFRPNGIAGHVTNTNSNGQQWCDSKYEINTSKGGLNAFSNIKQDDITNTNFEHHAEKPHRQRQEFTLENGELERGRFRKSNERNFWDSFPSQSPICGGDDGIPNLSHINTIQKENTMDRTLVIKSAIDEGRLIADIETGKIYSTVTKLNKGERIELIGANCNGYRVHNISYGGVKKQCRAHQIVWIYANGIYDKENLMIDHIDRNKSNNKLSNLRLVDAKGNMENKTHYEGKLTQEQKDEMYLLYTQGDHSMRELAEDYGMSKSRIQQLISEHSGMDGITFSKWRQESIKAYGNAIVPQVAYEIFKAIEKYKSI